MKSKDFIAQFVKKLLVKEELMLNIPIVFPGLKSG